MRILTFALVFFLAGCCATAFAAYSDNAAGNVSASTAATVGEGTIRGDVVSMDKANWRLSVRDLASGKTTEYNATSAEALGSAREGDRVIVTLKADGTVESVAKE